MNDLNKTKAKEKKMTSTNSQRVRESINLLIDKIPRNDETTVKAFKEIGLWIGFLEGYSGLRDFSDIEQNKCEGEEK